MWYRAGRSWHEGLQRHSRCVQYTFNLERMCVMTLESGTNCSDFIQTKNTEKSPLHSTHWESSLIFAFGLFFIYILPIPLFSFCFFLFLLMSHNELESIWAGPSIRDTSQDVSVTRSLPNPLCFFFFDFESLLAFGPVFQENQRNLRLPAAVSLL